MAYPDIEAALVDYLADLGTTGTWTPLDLQDHLPFLRIQRIGGPDDKYANTDYPNVLIQVLAARDPNSPRAAQALTETLRARLNAIAGLTVTDGLIDMCENVSGPIEVTYPDQTVIIIQTTYRFTTRAAA